MSSFSPSCLVKRFLVSSLLKIVWQFFGKACNCVVPSSSAVLDRLRIDFFIPSRLMPVQPPEPIVKLGKNRPSELCCLFIGKMDLGFLWRLGCPQPPTLAEKLWIHIKVELSGMRGDFIWVTRMVMIGADHTCVILSKLSHILKQSFRFPTMYRVGSCRHTCRWGRCSLVWIHLSWLSHTSPYKDLLRPVCFTSSIKWFTPLVGGLWGYYSTKKEPLSIFQVKLFTSKLLTYSKLFKERGKQQ